MRHILMMKDWDKVLEQQKDLANGIKMIASSYEGEETKAELGNIFGKLCVVRYIHTTDEDSNTVVIQELDTNDYTIAVTNFIRNQNNYL